MWTIVTLGVIVQLVLELVPSTYANYVFVDKWGQEYCRSSYCGLMDFDGWAMCCDRYRKCCAYMEYGIDGIKAADPFAYEIITPRTTAAPTTKRTTTTTTTTTTTPEPTTDAETLGDLPPVPPGQSPGLLRAGQPMASLRLPSLPQLKPEADARNSNNQWHSGPNDVTFMMPPVAPNVEEMRQDEHQRESCRSKFCALMSVSQWNHCCIRFKNCCAYVSFLSYEDPFYYEKGPNDP